MQEFSQPAVETQTVEWHILTLRKFTEICKESGIFLALVSRLEAANQTQVSLPHDTQELPKEFKDIMWEYIAAMLTASSEEHPTRYWLIPGSFPVKPPPLN